MDRGNRAMALSGEPHVLVVAGSDSSGGAGIGRDVETIAALGSRSCLAVTAVTVQTHHAVERLEPVAAALVADQMRAALSANRVAAIKIGMLGSAATVEAVAGVLAMHREIPAVLDPVIAATSGGVLLEDQAQARLKHALLQLCTLVTPNLAELAALGALYGCGSDEIGAAEVRADECQTFMELQARALLGFGCSAVLAKGGHGGGPLATDLLVRPGRPTLSYTSSRVPVAMRGTGCMLSSAIAATLAQGHAIEQAVRLGKSYVDAKLRGG